MTDQRSEWLTVLRELFVTGVGTVAALAAMFLGHKYLDWSFNEMIGYTLGAFGVGAVLAIFLSRPRR